MAKARKNSRNKGAVGERELAAVLNELFGTKARRGQQYNGLEGEDVVGLPGIHVESKRVQALNIDKAIDQACEDSKNLKVPVVFHRKNHRPWLVTVKLQDLERLVKAMQQVIENRDKSDAS
jgi:hypothetical protein